MNAACALSPLNSRTVLLTSPDAGLRQRLRDSLTGLRWRVHEASGGAEALAVLELQRPEAMLMDHWLPDLEATEFAGQIARQYPTLDLLRMDGGSVGPNRSARRNELLLALHGVRSADSSHLETWKELPLGAPAEPIPTASSGISHSISQQSFTDSPKPRCIAIDVIPGLIGSSEPMRELARLIRMVAPRTSRVLIEGETGTGKEVVAHAIHRLSVRAKKPLVILNCAAIPEALLEAELFGHTRGAFTGAVQSRTGRIEAADGGTLFLDEIGEMPLALQAKMLRFLECGELQRIGENETVRVDVRVIAATHQPLEERAAEGRFRLDLYHRLAVFPIEIPALRERMEDLPELAEHLLARLGKEAPRKRLGLDALEALAGHNWPGNVRELAHVLERATILAGDAAEIGAEHTRYRRTPRG